MKIARRDCLSGKVRIPDAPGWGVTIDSAWLDKAAYQKCERPAK